MKNLLLTLLRIRAACLFVLLGTATSGPLAAQDAAPAASPPGLISAPDLVWPEEVPLPDPPYLEITVVIDTQGVGTLEALDADESVVARVRVVLAAAQFKPAMRNGAPVASKVTLRLRVVPPAPPPEPAPVAPTTVPSKPVPAAPSKPTKPATKPAPAATEPESEPYAAVARVESTPANATRLKLEEMREVPGAFGDPFRVMDTMPGTVPVLSGLPYVYIRGAPPSGTVYFYDDINLPLLFHFALGPSVIHPTLVGPIDFYSGVAPARYGRYTGGVISGRGPEPHAPRLGGELELRLIDINGMLEVPVGKKGSLMMAGRYGYPGLMLSIFAPDTSLAYWDYQTRFTMPLTSHSEFQLLWFGSYDSVGERNDEGKMETSLALQFHRLELRYLHHWGEYSWGVALSTGYDQSLFEDALKINSYRIGPRAWLGWRRKNLRLRVGADGFGIFGKLRDTSSENTSNDIDDSVNFFYASVKSRRLGGVYGEAEIPISDSVRIKPGVRSDVWLTGSDSQAAVDPRLVTEWDVDQHVTLHVGAGLAHQPAVFQLPVPGLADVAVDNGLQESVQGEVGARVKLPEDFELEAQLFTHWYRNMLFPDLGNIESVCDMEDECENGYPRSQVLAYGGELLLRRDISKRLSGWLTYTLAWADAQTEQGQSFTPSFDVRHVGNLVFQWDMGKGFRLGLRAFARSGKLLGDGDLFSSERQTRREPGFYRGDFMFSYAWRTSWGQMRAALEWLNFTFSREVLSYECSQNQAGQRTCAFEKSPPITVPSLSLRGQF